MSCNPKFNLLDDPVYRKIGESNPTNSLLVRPELGKSKMSTYSLPGQDFVYGAPNIPDSENCKQVVGSWQDHTSSRGPKPVVDFVLMNKEASQAGCVSAHEFSLQRKAHLKFKTRQTRSPGKNMDDKIFGRASVPDGNFHELISNQYQRNFIAQQRIKEAEPPITRHLIAPVHTRASIGHSYKPPQEPSSPFKLKKFENIPSRAFLGSSPKSVSKSPQRVNDEEYKQAFSGKELERALPVS